MRLVLEYLLNWVRLETLKLIKPSPPFLRRLHCHRRPFSDVATCYCRLCLRRCCLLLRLLHQLKVMELDGVVTDDHQQHEEEYVLLDLDDVCGKSDIPPDEPYILSGLDTLNPILTIGDKLKLIGEYEDTIGTCLVFSEIGNDNMGCSSQATSKQVKPVTSLQKILKFRLLSEDDCKDSTEKTSDPSEQVEKVADH